MAELDHSIENRGSSFSTPFSVGLACVAVAGILLAIVGGHPRGDNNRATCANNQHEIWTAVQVFESRQQRYPGWRRTLTGREISWPQELMPLLGMKDTYQAWENADGTPPLPHVSQFICPLEELATRNLPKLSYAVNCGLPDVYADELQETQACGLFFDHADHVAEKIYTTAEYVMDHDGLAHTLGVGENVRVGSWTGYFPGTTDVKEFLVGFNWQYYAQPPAEHWLRFPVNQRTETDGEVLTDLAKSSQGARLNGPHANIVVVTFADGHMQFLSDKIDERVYNKLCTPDGAYQPHADWPAQEALVWEEYNK